MNDLGCCYYCGKTAILDYPKEATEETKDKMATNVCDCTQAKIERDKELEIERAKERIEQLFGNDTKQMGFEPMPELEIHKLMNTVVELIANRLIRGVTIEINSETKAKLAVSAKGKINIERSQAIKYKLEA